MGIASATGVMDTLERLTSMSTNVPAGGSP